MHRTDQQLHEHVAPNGSRDGGRRTNAGAWMRANLTTQGYCLSDAERVGVKGGV